MATTGVEILLQAVSAPRGTEGIPRGGEGARTFEPELRRAFEVESGASKTPTAAPAQSATPAQASPHGKSSAEDEAASAPQEDDETLDGEVAESVAADEDDAVEISADAAAVAPTPVLPAPIDAANAALAAPTPEVVAASAGAAGEALPSTLEPGQQREAHAWQTEASPELAAAQFEEPLSASTSGEAAIGSPPAATSSQQAETSPLAAPTSDARTSEASAERPRQVQSPQVEAEVSAAAGRPLQAEGDVSRDASRRDATPNDAAPMTPPEDQAAEDLRPVGETLPIQVDGGADKDLTLSATPIESPVDSAPRSAAATAGTAPGRADAIAHFTAASLDPDPASSADRARFVGRVEGAIRAAQQRDGRVQVRLSPPELGLLRIELTVQQGVLAARLEADTPAARNLLLDSLPVLRERLAQQEIRVERFDVDVRSDAGGGSNHNSHQDGATDRPLWRQDLERRQRAASGQSLRPEGPRPAARVASDASLDVRV